ncbi:TetR/AcrR family transcriptional regulator [Asticcacaulis sp. 201]|uniref:TetR/AcrR family transcriptional regulator n=1 Tax=Asticcacaulis sp. 201 TaxID=3028787 RepID=UPI0029169E83|nr:TetR/AcrR family transcriptional regulator [Asticcacaulis sp. 201]MDV6332658.1 TetR/AcrR family transcriptional regulator [Asticcacaulis sp. 201]
MADTRTAPNKRQDIIDQAYRRFYDGGFHATGIDTVMADTGISKRTLYKYFPSKEDLIEAVLDQYSCDTETQLFAPATALSDDPRRQIEAVFDVRRDLMAQKDYQGCLAMKAGQEYIGKHEGIAARGKGASLYVENKFIDLCRKAGVKHPEETGRQINLLFQGTALTAQMQRDLTVFDVAKKALHILLADA